MNYQDHATHITRRLVDMIQTGTHGQWAMPWHTHDLGDLLNARNATTGSRYNGANVLTLAVEALDAGTPQAFGPPTNNGPTTAPKSAKANAPPTSSEGSPAKPTPTTNPRHPARPTRPGNCCPASIRFSTPTRSTATTPRPTPPRPHPRPTGSQRLSSGADQVGRVQSFESHCLRGLPPTCPAR